MHNALVIAWAICWLIWEYLKTPRVYLRIAAAAAIGFLGSWTLVQPDHFDSYWSYRWTYWIMTLMLFYFSFYLIGIAMRNHRRRIQIRRILGT